MDIIIDTAGQADLATRDRLIESDDDLEMENTVRIDSSNIFDETLFAENSKSLRKPKLNPAKDIDLDEFERDMGWKSKGKHAMIKALTKKANVSSIVKEVTPIEKVLQKSAIKPGFEQLEAVPPYKESERQLQKQRRMEREKTMGKKWYNLPATEMTDEIKHDLEVIQMRSVLDPKHFYKKNDLKVLPKYFQIGKVVDSPVDYYSGRLTKKERKKTIVDELMADAEFAKYNKRKYKEIIEQKNKLHYKAHKHAKRLKTKKKK